MERWQLIVIVVVASAAWFLYKRYVKKEPIWGEGMRPPQPEVENWYAVTMDAVDNMDEALRSEREAEWDAKSDEEKLKFAQEFMKKEFGQQAVDGYNRKQRMKIGMARFVTRPDEEDASGGGEDESDGGPAKDENGSETGGGGGNE